MSRKAHALDQYLVIKALAGGDGAFEPLFARWHHKFLRHAYRCAGEAELARDCVQESWIEIVHGLHRLKEAAAFQAWAFRIVTRRCAKAVRRLERDRRLEHGLKTETESQAVTKTGLYQSTDASALKAAIAALPRDQRIAIDLFYLDELSVAEIAVVLGVPVGTIKTRLMHARRKLRATLEGEET